MVKNNEKINFNSTSFAKIIGISPLMKSLFKKIEKICSLDLNFAIQGEDEEEIIFIIKYCHNNSRISSFPLFFLDRFDFHSDKSLEKYISSLSNICTIAIKNIGSKNINIEENKRLIFYGKNLNISNFDPSIFFLKIPSMEERMSDIPLILSELINEKGLKVLFSPQLISYFMSIKWPDIVFFKNIMNRILDNYETYKNSDFISINSLSTEVEKEISSLKEERKIKFGHDNNSQGDKFSQFLIDKNGRFHKFNDAKKYFYVFYLKNLFSFCNGNITQASIISSIGRPYLYKKVKEHNIDPSDYRK